MGKLNIAGNIQRYRRERGLTQEDLAEHLGVSKASVSKWETGQSCPDIAFLPQLATFFATTIDELVGYAPQMSKEEIRRTYRELKTAFAVQTFDEALGRCRVVIHDYWSCYPLLVQMAVLYLNHFALAPEGEVRAAFADEIVALTSRIRVESDDSACVRQACTVEASIRLALGDAAGTVALVGPSVAPAMGETTLLASAYQALGDTAAAEQTSQVAVYQALVGLLNDLPQLALHAIDRPERLRVVYARTQALIEAFDLDSLYVNSAAISLVFANAFVSAGCIDEAFGCLERYVKQCSALTFPIKLHGDDFFDLVDPWFDELDLGDDTPRSSELVKQGMVQALTVNPAFTVLADDPRYRMLVANLEEVVR